MFRFENILHLSQFLQLFVLFEFEEVVKFILLNLLLFRLQLQHLVTLLFVDIRQTRGELIAVILMPLAKSCQFILTKIQYFKLILIGGL